MQVAKVQRANFTIPSGQASGTFTLSGFDDLTKMVVFGSWSLPSGSTSFTDDRCFVDLDVTNLTTLTATRISTDAEVVTVEAYVVQFGDDTNVYKGTFSMVSDGTIADQTATANINGGSAMTLNDVTKAFCWSYYTNDETNSSDGRPQSNQIQTRFDSTSVIGFERQLNLGAASGHWYAVESSTLTVEHLVTSMAAVSTVTETDTPGTTISNVANTFWLSSYTSNLGNYNDNGCWDIYLTNATTVTFNRGINDTGTFTGEFVTQIVQDSNLSTAKGQWSSSSATESAAVSVDLTRSIPILASGHPARTQNDAWQDGHNDEFFMRCWFSSGSQIDGASGTAPVTDRNISWQAVQFPTEGAPATPRRVMVIS